ncbi:MAG: PilZ domain-containing protein [Deltaproteobacteria bacterium]|nr:PilZ domain-containing protein [Deltaproteobacteria bacterium]
MDGLVAGNQRRDLRIPFDSDIRYSMDQFNWHLGRADNISKGGIFVATEKMLKLGSRVYLNFNLPNTFQNIKTTGEVVRMANAEEGSMGGEFSGMGIRLSLPSEELMIRSFIRGILNNSVPVRSSTMQKSQKHILKVETKNTFVPVLKWWVKEIFTKLVKVNYLVAELVVLVFILVLIKTVFTR